MSAAFSSLDIQNTCHCCIAKRNHKNSHKKSASFNFRFTPNFLLMSVFDVFNCFKFIILNFYRILKLFNNCSCAKQQVDTICTTVFVCMLQENLPFHQPHEDDRWRIWESNLPPQKVCLPLSHSPDDFNCLSLDALRISHGTVA